MPEETREPLVSGEQPPSTEIDPRSYGSDGAPVSPDATQPPVDAQEQPPEPTYTRAQLQEQLDAQRRELQSAKDREIAQERDRVHQSAYNERVISEAQQYLQQTMQEDPDEFARLLQHPEIASFWGQLAGAQVNQARQSIEAEVRSSLGIQMTAEAMRTAMHGIFTHPVFEGWKQADFEKAELWPPADAAKYTEWHSKAISYIAKKEAEKLAPSVAEAVEAEARNQMAGQNGQRRDHVPSTGGRAPRMTYAQLQKASKAQIDALSSAEFEAILNAG